MMTRILHEIDPTAMLYYSSAVGSIFGVTYYYYNKDLVNVLSRYKNIPHHSYATVYSV